MTRMTKAQVIAIHRDLQNSTGGNPDVRDDDMLDNVLAAPFQSRLNHELYLTPQMKAARLCCGFVCDSPMSAGNAKTGIHLMLIFLSLCDVNMHYSADNLRSLVDMLKPSHHLYEDVLSWILDHQFM
ncbi:Fic family protein [Flavonifractor sp. An306]|uniref:Fic family protein n=1 Tax=Flavonifractor sp. An306 TaxID=1965629 RepID=UPI001749509D|nr:Fic family protein [Flavonifractor sp. An306]